MTKYSIGDYILYERKDEWEIVSWEIVRIESIKEAQYGVTIIGGNNEWNNREFDSDDNIIYAEDRGRKIGKAEVIARLM